MCLLIFSVISVWSPGLNIAHCVTGLGQIKLTIGQVDFGGQVSFKSYMISVWRKAKFWKSVKWKFLDAWSPDQHGFIVVCKMFWWWDETLNLNVQESSYLGLTRSISWLLMPWLLSSPWHQQPWYCLCRIGRSLSYLRKDFNYLCHINVEE